MSAAGDDITAAIHKQVEENPVCPYRHGDRGANPHGPIPLAPPPKIGASVLDFIGNTPLVRVERLCKADGVECEVLAKCEYFNSGGSVKDRIGLRMIEDAEKAGRIKPGDTLIEPTSGNTGIGLALAGAVKGYKVVITMPEKMSHEKVVVLEALGAKIYRTPTSAAWDAPESHIALALRLQKEMPNAHVLDQYSAPGNPMAHYDGTAEEILQQCDGKLDCVVLGAGTGGTITGVARKIKEKYPNVHIVGVDPVGSILAQPEELNVPGPSYQVEGTGYDFLPKVLDRGCVDEWVKSVDKESFVMARRLIREEGILCGGSAGATMHHALQIAKRYKKGQRVVALLADSCRNYLSKHLDDGWMIEHGFYEDESKAPGSNAEFLSRHKVQDLELASPVTVLPDATVGEVLALLNKHAFDQVPVVSESGDKVLGVATLGNVSARLLAGKVRADSPITDVIYTQYGRVSPGSTLLELSKAFNKDHFALVVVETQSAVGGELVSRAAVTGVVTQIDLLNFVVANN